MSSIPPLLGLGLIRPPRTLAQEHAGRSPLTPRTPTPWERADRLAARKSFLDWWGKACVTISVVGLCLHYNIMRGLIMWALWSGSWYVCYRLAKYTLLWFYENYERFPAWCDEWWAMGGPRRDRIWASICRVPRGARELLRTWLAAGSKLELFRVVWFAVGAWWKGENLRALPGHNKRMPGNWNQEDEYLATRYSRDEVSPRALRIFKIPFVFGQSPFWNLVLGKLGRTKLGEVRARTQYLRRRGKYLVSQEEIDEYKEDADDEDDGEPLPKPPRVVGPAYENPPANASHTKLRRRLTSLKALRTLGMDYVVWDDEYVVVSQVLKHEDAGKIYALSQIIRRHREGLGPQVANEDDGYDLGQTEGDDGEGSDDSDSDYSDLPMDTRQYVVASTQGFNKERAGRSHTPKNPNAEERFDIPMSSHLPRPYAYTSYGRKEDLGLSSDEDTFIHQGARTSRPYSHTPHRPRPGSSSGEEHDDIPWTDRPSQPYSHTPYRPRSYPRTNHGMKEDIRGTKKTSEDPSTSQERRRRPYASTPGGSHGPHTMHQKMPRPQLARQSPKQPLQPREDNWRVLPKGSIQLGSIPVLSLRPYHGSKRNPFVPRRGGDHLKPSWLAIGAETTKSEREKNEEPVDSTPRRSPPYSSCPKNCTSFHPPCSPKSYQMPQTPFIPRPVNKEAPTRPQTTTSTPRPRRKAARPEPIPTDRTPSPPTVPKTSPPAPRRAPLPLVKSLSSKVTSLRTDCIALWTTYHALVKEKKPIDIQLQCQKLRLQVEALESILTRIVQAKPPLIISSIYLDALDPSLDDSIGLLQLFKQTLNEENSACLVLSEVRFGVSCIIQGIAKFRERAYEGSDDSVSDVRRQRLRLLIPHFSIQDEEAARAAEDKKLKEKEARHKAEKEKLEKEQAEKAEAERLASMSPMDVNDSQQQEQSRPPPATGITGPYVNMLRSWVLQGFLPTYTSGERLLCGIRALVISLEAMGRLDPGTITSTDILKRMFEDHETDGPLGTPTPEYHLYLLEEVKRLGGEEAKKEYDLLRKKNDFEADHLYHMLKLMFRWNLVKGDDNLVLGVVTTGLNNGVRNDPATAHLIDTANPVAGGNVVWVHNDNALSNGAGPYSHWSGFARNAHDSEAWIPMIERWGFAVPNERQSRTQKPQTPQIPRQTEKQHQDEARTHVWLQVKKQLRALSRQLREHRIQFEVYRVLPASYPHEIEAKFQWLCEQFPKQLEAFRPVGSRDEQMAIREMIYRLDSDARAFFSEMKPYERYIHGQHAGYSDGRDGRRNTNSENHRGHRNNDDADDRRRGGGYGGRDRADNHSDQPRSQTPGTDYEAGSRKSGGGRGGRHNVNADDQSGYRNGGDADQRGEQRTRGGQRGRGGAANARGNAEGRSDQRNDDSGGQRGRGGHGGGESGSRGGRTTGRGHDRRDSEPDLSI